MRRIQSKLLPHRQKVSAVLSRNHSFSGLGNHLHQLHRGPLVLETSRYFSAVASKAPEVATKSKKNNSNVFLDNLGTIFLSSIALIIASLVRSSYGTSNKNKVRDTLEEQASIDPMEMDDLRIANSELDITAFKLLSTDLFGAFPDGQATYEEVMRAVRNSLTSYIESRQNLRMVGTIEFGHIIDRVVLGALEKRRLTSDQSMPVLFWITVLSLALNAPVPDRIQLLYSLMEESNESVTIQDVRTMVGYLQDTCQLVPEAQIVPTNAKYPVQKYECGTPEQLVEWEGDEDEKVDVDAFAAILRSRSVCAWGECYHKKKFV